MDYFEIGGEKYLAIVLLPDAWHLCSTTVILKRNASTAQFEFYQDLQTVGTQKVVSFVTSWNATYLLTVNSNQSCSSTSGEASHYCFPAVGYVKNLRKRGKDLLWGLVSEVKF